MKLLFRLLLTKCVDVTLFVNYEQKYEINFCSISPFQFDFYVVLYF